MQESLAGESVILPLLASTIHYINSIGLRVDEFHTRMYNIGFQVANSLFGPEIRDLRNTVSDLSRRVAAPPFFAPHLSLQSTLHPPTQPQEGQTGLVVPLLQ